MAPIRVHVEQNRPGIPDQTAGPTGDDAGADDARERIHPEPSETRANSKPTITSTDTAASAITWTRLPAYCCRAAPPVRVLVFLEGDNACRRRSAHARRILAAPAFLDRFQIAPASIIVELLARSAWPHGFDDA